MGDAPESGTGLENRSRQRQRDRGGRKNAALACDICRKKRVRCLRDPGEAVCKGCAAGGMECSFTGNDRRKESMADLRNKLTQFEQLFATLEKPGLQDPTNRHLAAAAALHSQPLPVSPDQLGLPSETSSTSSTSFATLPLLTGREDIQASLQPTHKRQKIGQDASPPMSYSSAAGIAAPLPNPFPAPSNASEERSPSLVGPHNSSNGPLVDHLAIEAGGIRAYGPTSNQTLAVENPEVGSDTQSRGDKYEARLRAPTTPPGYLNTRPSLLAAAARNISDIPLGTDIRTVEHLLNLYFIWHHPVFPVVSCKVFLDDFEKGGRYCSPLLLNAILALASHLSDWTLVRSQTNEAQTTGATFFRKAKTLLDDELENPSVTTVQALCLMAKYEAYHGRALQGGLYMVMGGRLVLDLGLHLDPSHLVQRGVLGEEDAWIRARTFWGVWSVDKEFSALVGRPSAVRGVLITCPRPAYWEADDFDWCASYKRGHLVGIKDRMKDGVYYISELATDMAGVHLRAMDQMYWRENKPMLEENLAALEQHMAATSDSMAALPSFDIEPGEQANPHILTLHMVYYCHIIILNRPFLFAGRSGSTMSPQRSRCFESAREIVRLMGLIRDATPDGLRTTLNCHQHNLVTAAAVMILESTPKMGPTSAETAQLSHSALIAREDLAKIFSMLETMAAFRPAAKQAVDNLRDLHMTRETQRTLATMAGGQADRTGPSNHEQFQGNGAASVHEPYSLNGNHNVNPIDPLLDFDFTGGMTFGGADEHQLFPDLDSFFAQQQNYLYPTLACSDLFDNMGFLHTQMMQSRPPSRNGHTD